MANIPDDVLRNIFFLLPAKLVAQMRCVSKPWNALLSQQCFIKAHLHHSVQNNKEILLEFNCGFYFGDREQCIAKYSRPPNRELPNFIEFPVDRPPLGKCFVIGSVNGLICLINVECFCCPTTGVNIWNPSLSALLHLPPYSVRPRRARCEDIYFRFGFTPKTDDYKVVKIEKLGKLRNKDGLQVEVYSMKSGSWKLITERFPSHVRICSIDELCQDGQDGHVHWLCVHSMTKQLTIVAFDLHEEIFCQIPLPDGILYNGRDTLTLGMWNGKLCVTSYNINGNVEVWLMNEYKVAQSWVNPYNFKEFISHTKFAFRFKVKNATRFQAYHDHLAMYDTVSKSYKYMMRLKRPRPFMSIIVRYVDSLVWVAPSKSGSTLATSANSKRKRKIDAIDDEW